MKKSGLFLIAFTVSYLTCRQRRYDKEFYGTYRSSDSVNIVFRKICFYPKNIYSYYVSSCLWHDRDSGAFFLDGDTLSFISATPNSPIELNTLHRALTGIKFHYSKNILTFIDKNFHETDTIYFSKSNDYIQSNTNDPSEHYSTLADNRGITLGEMLFYIEDDLKTITASNAQGQVRWSSNIIDSCGVPAIGNPAIRDIRPEKDNLIVSFGKHSFANVDIKTGKTTFLGAD